LHADELAMATLTVDKPKDAITALLQERQRYEQWLAGLESRRASTPAHVYARVRADYEGRLSRVVDELGGRSAELRQVVDALSSQVASLQDEETEKRDMQAEAELRAAVGEYTAEQWHQVSQSSQAELTRLAALKADAASELAQVQQLLNMASVRRPAAPPSPARGSNAGSCGAASPASG
jgi:chromosome segregation ATPase